MQQIQKASVKANLRTIKVSLVDSIFLESMELGRIDQNQGRNLKENGMKIKLMVLELTLGRMEGSTRENGSSIRWMESVCTHGQMEKFISANMWIISSKAMVYLN